MINQSCTFEEYNTKLLLRVASFMAKNGIVDISYNQLEEIINCLEEDLSQSEYIPTLKEVGTKAIADSIKKELNKDYD